MDDTAVTKQISIAFEYCYLHSDWVYPLEDTLAGIDAGTAKMRLGPDSKCIWEIVLHMAVWNENIVERIQARQALRPSEGHWPPLPAMADEVGWSRAKGRLWDSLESVQTTIRESCLSDIEAGPYGLADLLCRFIHNGYHIGQITILRETLERLRSNG